MCVSTCTLWDVSEEILSGTRNDVSSSAAELGHREVDKERKDKESDSENIETNQTHRMLELDDKILSPVPPAFFKAL